MALNWTTHDTDTDMLSAQPKGSVFVIARREDGYYLTVTGRAGSGPGHTSLEEGVFRLDQAKRRAEELYREAAE